MCGIWSLVNLRKSNKLDFVKLFSDFMNIKHRGPDNSYFETYNNVVIGFHRLAIMDDTFNSNQPFIYEDENRTIVFLCNGEIYNFREIIEKYNLPEIKNDCSVLHHVYGLIQQGHLDVTFQQFMKEDVRGEFSFTIFEFDRFKNLSKVIVGRDPIGVRPLYYHPYQHGNDYLFFTSEIKGGLSYPGELIEFPPNTVMEFNFNEVGQIYTSSFILSHIYLTQSKSLDESAYLQSVQESVLNSVRRRLCADKPLAFLLSGGVDSSLVAGISAKILGKPLRTFCCSLMGEDGKGVGTDLKYARMVADHIGSNHTEVLFTPEEGLAAIPDVIRTIESYDVTSIRASVGQYIVCKYIGQNTDCKVVLVGEGPDEICNSYLFNWYCPNGEALDKCAKEYVQNIHYFDVKRADRCIARWGLEGRVPLLDTEFIKSYWTIPGEMRMPTHKEIEKWWFRKAFDGTSVIPDEVLWRQKSAFSDAISSKEKSWFQIIQEFIENKVTDNEMTLASEKYPYCTPKTKEAYYYRRIFCEIFGEHRQQIIPGFWLPKWNKDGKEVTEYTDPSARTLSVYNNIS
jgi:asparagine synthase (glutamine-hydrolysing)